MTTKTKTKTVEDVREMQESLTAMIAAATNMTVLVHRVLEQLSEEDEKPVRKNDVEKKESAPAKPEASFADETETTIENCRQAIQNVVNSGGTEVAREILGQFSAKKISDLDPVHYDEFVRRCADSSTGE